MNAPEFPTPWQRKTLWTAATAFAIAAIGAIAIAFLWLVSRVLGFLQPILIPFAVAGVLAYLLDPVVERLQRWGTTRRRAVMAVFAVMTLVLFGITLWIVPAITSQAGKLIKRIPTYSMRVRDLTVGFARDLQSKVPSLKLFPGLPAPDRPDGPTPATKEVPPGTPTEAAAKAAQADDETNVPAPAITGDTKVDDTALGWQQIISGRWMETSLPILARNAWHFVVTSVGGFLGVFGFLLSLIIVPVYLWYFLIESPNISASWGDYVPLTKSAFKDEVVSVLEEINGYLIAFFRGQLLVSMINGTFTAIGLAVVGLDFGLLIGLLLCVLNLIPYLGIMLCWVPAVIIASVTPSSTFIPHDHWWLLPVVVTGVFTVVQQVDGLFVTPKVVGESVGLHPMTVIVSVFAWSLLMGGLLGAILAVPMTATLKVLLRRYVWEKRILAEQKIVHDETGTQAAAHAAPAPEPEPAAAK